jgi:hypothetical protein
MPKGKLPQSVGGYVANFHGGPARSKSVYHGDAEHDHAGSGARALGSHQS